MGQARRVRSWRAADRRRARSSPRPDQEVDQLVLVLLSAINLARRSIRVATPYFLPDEQLITALQLAVLRGVDVHLVLPCCSQAVISGAARCRSTIPN
jgi:cardiolipin synthase A/B